MGDRRWRRAVPQAAADAHPVAAGRHVPGSRRHPADRLLRRRAKRSTTEQSLLERRKELEMSTDRNIKSMGSSFGSIALSLLVLVSAGLVWCGTPAQSATTTQAATPAPSATVDTTLLIPVSGSVTTADGTKITFAGNVTVKSSAVTNLVGI